MNVHDELRSLISKLTEVNKRKLHKPLFPKVFIPRSFPKKELCVLRFFFLLYSFLTSKDLSHSIQQFFEVSPEEGLCSSALCIKHLHS